MRNIAIIELTQSGHHESYVHLYSRLFLKAGCRVIVFYPNPTSIKQWIDKHCTEFTVNFDASEIQHPHVARFQIRFFSPLIQAMRRWATVSKALSSYASKNEINFDFVFFDYLDYFLLPFPLSRITLRAFPSQWGGIFLQPSRLFRVNTEGRRVRSGIDIFDILRSRQCRLVGSLQEDFAPELGAFIPAGKLKVFPDITDDSLPENESALAKSIKVMVKGRNVIGFFGKFRPEKGLLSFIDLVMASGAERHFFLMFGEVDTAKFSVPERQRIQAFVSSPPANCFVCSRRFDDEAVFNELINLCDVIFAAFLNYPYSSNTLTKAALFKKLLIVSNGFCIEERVRQYRLGTAINQNDPQAGLKALEDIARNYSVLSENADFAGYLKEHSEAKVIMILKETHVL